LNFPKRNLNATHICVVVGGSNQLQYDKLKATKRRQTNMKSIIVTVMSLMFLCIFVGLIILIIRALWKYLKSKDVRQEKSEVRKSLGQVLKQHRTRCKITQEFVAETIGVSRQAVSKWESGTSDPSTSNLIALAKLYGISAEDLLRIDI
jgi:DNA-binding XRE family transcriptional regulator